MLWVTIDEHAAMVRERDAARAEVARLRVMLRRAEAWMGLIGPPRAPDAFSGVGQGAGKGAAEIGSLAGSWDANGSEVG